MREKDEKKRTSIKDAKKKREVECVDQEGAILSQLLF